MELMVLKLKLSYNVNIISAGIGAKNNSWSRKRGEQSDKILDPNWGKSVQNTRQN
jgi:hypothetical protein